MYETGAAPKDNESWDAMRTEFAKLISGPATPASETLPPVVQVASTANQIGQEVLVAQRPRASTVAQESPSIPRLHLPPIPVAANANNHQITNLVGGRARSRTLGDVGLQAQVPGLSKLLLQSPLLTAVLGNLVPEAASRPGRPTADDLVRYVGSQTHHCGVATESAEHVTNLRNACALLDAFVREARSQHPESKLASQAGLANAVADSRVAVSQILGQVVPSLSRVHWEDRFSALETSIRREPRLAEILNSCLTRTDDAVKTFTSMLTDAAVILTRPGDNLAGGGRFADQMEAAVSKAIGDLHDKGLDAKGIKATTASIKERLDARSELIEQRRADPTKTDPKILKAASEADAESIALEGRIEAADQKVTQELAAPFRECLGVIEGYAHALIDGAPCNPGSAVANQGWGPMTTQICRDVNAAGPAVVRLVTGSKKPAAADTLLGGYHRSTINGLAAAAVASNRQAPSELSRVQFLLTETETLVDAARASTASNCERLFNGLSSRAVEVASKLLASHVKKPVEQLSKYESPELNAFKGELAKFDATNSYHGLRDARSSALDASQRANEDMRTADEEIESLEKELQGAAKTNPAQVPELRIKLDDKLATKARLLGIAKGADAKLKEAEKRFDIVNTDRNQLVGKVDDEQQHCQAVTSLLRLAVVYQQQYTAAHLTGRG